MIISPSRHVGVLLTLAVTLSAACDGDNDVTSPTIDRDAPSVEITAAPDASPAGHEVAIAFTATDGVALESVECGWGTPGTPPAVFLATGKSLSGSCAHAYDAPGQYTVVIRATDAAGNEAGQEHGITIGDPIPAAPTSVAVSTVWNEAIVRWTPGEAATSQQVVVSHAGGLEPDRVASFADGVTGSASFPALSWDASYEAVVVAENGSGRAESAPVSFEAQIPEAPVLTSFSTPVWTEPLWYGMGGFPDPTCLYVEWTPTLNSLEYRVVLSGLPEGDSFESRMDNSATEEMFCAADYPIVDGTTYEAQVFAVRGSEEIGSEILGCTADFDPEYSATGTWSGVCGAAGFIESCDMTLEIVDTDGALTGAWTRTCSSGSDDGPLSGTRTDWSVNMTIQDAGAYDLYFSGVIYTADRIEAFYGIDGLIQPCTVDRQ
jgi:hypothetical protein